MESVIAGLVSGLLVVFLAWLAKTLFLARRLYLIKPKLFDYSDLVDARDSKTVELTVFNGGAKAEEEVRVQLSPAFKYTILASNSAGLVVDPQGVMKLDRLAPKQDLTVVLTAEGGEFRKEHIVGITSKDTVGKIKESLQDAQLTPGQSLVGFFVVLVFFPLFGYFFGNFIKDDVWPEFAPQLVTSTAIKFQRDSKVEVNNISADKKALALYQQSYSIDGVKRAGDVVTLDLNLKNTSDKKLTFTVSTATPISEKRTSGLKYIVVDVLVFPGTEKLVSLSDYLPKEVTPQLVSLEVIVDGAGGRAYFTQDVVLTE